MKRRILFSVLCVLAAAGAFAQGQGLAGINEATSLMTSYFDPATKLCYAIGAVLGLVGGIKTYGKFSSGDQTSSLSWMRPVSLHSLSGSRPVCSRRACSRRSVSGPILPAISASRTSSVAKVSSCCLAIKAGRTCTASAITSMAQSTRTHTSMYPSPRRDLKIRFSTWLPPRLKSDPFPDTEHYIRSKYWR